MTAPVLVHPADLEPSHVGRRTYVSRRRYMPLDAATVVCTMLVLLTVIPAQLILPGMTDLGRPALVVAMLMWLWWAASKLNPWLVMVGPNPIRWAVLLYLVTAAISYAIGEMRGLTAIEKNGADRAMLFAAVFAGVVLMVADGLPNWGRVKFVMRFFVWCATFMAIVGLLQSILKYDVTRFLLIPGLQSKGWVPDMSSRGAGLRIASTTSHFIEFSAVMALALPLGIHFAMYSVDKVTRRRYVIMTLLIAAAIPAAVSRTGIAAMVLGIAILLPVWSWRARYNVLLLGVGLLAVLMVTRPGLLGTVRDMFTNANQDTSVTARTGRYELVGHYFAQTPWFGRGIGTWIPPQYQILDNQWLTTALASGIAGIAALATVHITALVLSIIALRRAGSPEGRHLCAVLVAAQAVALMVAAFFDSMSFTTYATAVAMMVGFSGTVWRLTHPSRQIRTSTTRWYLA